MTEDTPIDGIRSLLRGPSGAIDAPAVDPLRSVIRSGENFLFGGQNAGTVAAPAAQPAPAQPVTRIGAVVLEWGFSVRDEVAAQFRRWLEDNEDELRQVTPQGVRYLGTFAVVAQSDLSLGDYRTIWSADSIAETTAMEASFVAGGRFGQLLTELNSFRDRRIGAGRSQQIYQPAASTHKIP
jgi:hypothetical protein